MKTLTSIANVNHLNAIELKEANQQIVQQLLAIRDACLDFPCYEKVNDAVNKIHSLIGGHY